MTVKVCLPFSHLFNFITFFDCYRSSFICRDRASSYFWGVKCCLFRRRGIPNHCLNGWFSVFLRKQRFTPWIPLPTVLSWKRVSQTLRTKSHVSSFELMMRESGFTESSYTHTHTHVWYHAHNFFLFRVNIYRSMCRKYLFLSSFLFYLFLLSLSCVFNGFSCFSHFYLYIFQSFCSCFNRKAK